MLLASITESQNNRNNRSFNVKDSITSVISAITLKGVRNMKEKIGHLTHAFSVCSVALQHDNSGLCSSAPCALLHIHSVMRQPFYWTISVNSRFIVNMTVMQAYVRYVVGCTHFLQLAENRIDSFPHKYVIVKLCGHVLLETFYTSQGNGLVELNAVDTGIVSLTIQYQVHPRNTYSQMAYSRQEFKNHVIEFAEKPVWVYVEINIVKYIWYLYINPQLVRRIWYEYYTTEILKLVEFYCSLQYSQLYVERGLLPKVWLEHSPRTIDTSQAPAIFNMSGHVYASVLLKTLNMANIRLLMYFIEDKYHVPVYTLDSRDAPLSITLSPYSPIKRISLCTNLRLSIRSVKYVGNRKTVLPEWIRTSNKTHIQGSVSRGMMPKLS